MCDDPTALPRPPNFVDDEKLNIGDAESLISDLITNKDTAFLNRVRLFLSQFPFVVIGDDGEHYQLVKHGSFCEPDLVGHSTEAVVDDKPARATEMMVEEVTLETQTCGDAKITGRNLYADSDRRRYKA